MNGLFGPTTVIEIEERLVALQRKIGELRAWQATLINELDKINAHRSDASRTLAEWLQSHLDVNKDTARALVVAGRQGKADGAAIQADLADRTTFDRAVATHRLMNTGMSASEARATASMNLEDVRTLTARRHRVTPVDERKAFEERYFRIQPTLDESAWTINGRLTGMMGRVVDKAITQKADELRLLPTGDSSARAQRQADALVAILQDSLETSGDDRGHDSAGHVTVFVDARREATTDEPSKPSTDVTAEVAFGPQVGPDTLEAILCGGTVRVVGMDGDNPIASSNATRAIPPSVRDAVLFRDGGCTIDGCESRYRLEPHHVVPWSHGGSHDAANLTTLCWYHHHVAIHGSGYFIDSGSPPKRRRLTKHHQRRGPP